MRYLLDINAVIALLARRGAMDRRVRACAPEDFGLSAVVAYELHYGASKSRRPAENALRLQGLGFAVLDFTEADARCAGDIRARLEAAGMPIGPYDTLIAAQARARGLVLVTRNLREFRRIDGLLVEDWETS